MPPDVSNQRERRVPLLDLHAENDPLNGEILDAINGVIQSQRFILGAENEIFEREVAAYLRVPFAAGCANGSDALLLALMAAGIGPGDEVAVPSFTFFATAGAVSRAGATPVFVDIDEATFNIDPAALDEAARRHPLLKAVIPVHLYGAAADMDPILAIAARHGWTVIEDGAQSIGADYRHRRCLGLAHMGVLSFFPTKNLGAWGDAGMVVTTDEGLAKRLAALRVHGSVQKYRHDWIGINSRLDSLQAAVLSVKLAYLDSWIERRQSNAARYLSILGQANLPITLPQSQPWQSRHVWNQFVIRTPRRDEVKGFLAARHIGTEIYYPIPLHLQPCYAHLGYRNGELPVSEMACRDVLALPIHFSLAEDDQAYVCQKLIEFF